MILRSILNSISEARGASLFCFNTSAASIWILRSILRSISEARGASFVCFNTSAASSWG